MWVIVSVAIFGLYCLFMLYPILKMLIQSVFDNETGAFTFKYFTKFFSDSYYFSTLLNSFRVSIWATAITLVIGVPLAYLYNMYEIKGRNFL